MVAALAGPPPATAPPASAPAAPLAQRSVFEPMLEPGVGLAGTALPPPLSPDLDLSLRTSRGSHHQSRASSVPVPVP